MSSKTSELKNKMKVVVGKSKESIGTRKVEILGGLLVVSIVALGLVGKQYINQKTKITELNKLIQDKDNTIKQKEKDIQSKDEKLAKSANELSKKAKELKEKDRLIDAYSKESTELKSYLKELGKTVAVVENSFNVLKESQSEGVAGEVSDINNGDTSQVIP